MISKCVETILYSKSKMLFSLDTRGGILTGLIVRGVVNTASLNKSTVSGDTIIYTCVEGWS